MMPAKRESTNRLSGLSASIVGTLKQRIVGWQYPPEHRLTEESLCREFGVSRSPVREALRALVTNGFVRKMQNRGYAVRQLDLREVEELYDLRTAIELHVVERPPRGSVGRRSALGGAPARPARGRGAVRPAHRDRASCRRAARARLDRAPLGAGSAARDLERHP